MMKLLPLITGVVLLSTMVLVAAAPPEAQLVRQGDIKRDSARSKKQDYVFDKRYSHNRSYPKPGLRVRELPRGSRYLPYRRNHFYYQGGSWYRPVRDGFTVIIPPPGLVVSALPPYYTTIWVRGAPYYYAYGVYYVWRPDEGVYVVTEPPPESEVDEQPPMAEQLFIYPKAGQDDEQQASDRYECHSWSVEQTGFDPTRPGGNVPPEQHPDKRRDYQRAMKACLEARDYSVQ
ncbi:MAG: DUF6515 family protein [Desulfurivibrionaceae bacterium]|nr:hypothetical protein [Desulfobulbales bacterium]MDT8335492.1 DUF6515 family protein [Desulfurivibrionaceae bacterium]